MKQLQNYYLQHYVCFGNNLEKSGDLCYDLFCFGKEITKEEWENCYRVHHALSSEPKCSCNLHKDM